MVIDGIAVITILRFLVALPAEFVTLTEKPDVPAVVGVPEMTPVAAFKLKPAGSVPLLISQVIGVVPVAVSV